MSELDALLAYIGAVDRVSGVRPKEESALAEMAVTLAPMWALADSLGPWPELTPAGPLDSIDPAL